MKSMLVWYLNDIITVECSNAGLVIDSSIDLCDSANQSFCPSHA